jgi:hypothetical protein
MHKKDPDQYPAEADTPNPVIPREPCMLKCNGCDAIVMTTLSLETSIYTYVVGLAFVLLLSWNAVCLLPFVIPLCKSLIHRCSRCGVRIAALNPFNLPSLKDEVLTVNCGESCGIVLSRSYLATIVMVIVT